MCKRIQGRAIRKFYIMSSVFGWPYSSSFGFSRSHVLKNKINDHNFDLCNFLIYIYVIVSFQSVLCKSYDKSIMVSRSEVYYILLKILCSIIKVFVGKSLGFQFLQYQYVFMYEECVCVPQNYCFECLPILITNY